MSSRSFSAGSSFPASRAAMLDERRNMQRHARARQVPGKFPALRATFVTAHTFWKSAKRVRAPDSRRTVRRLRSIRVIESAFPPAYPPIPRPNGPIAAQFSAISPRSSGERDPAGACASSRSVAAARLPNSQLRANVSEFTQILRYRGARRARRCRTRGLRARARRVRPARPAGRLRTTGAPVLRRAACALRRGACEPRHGLRTCSGQAHVARGAPRRARAGPDDGSGARG